MTDSDKDTSRGPGSNASPAVEYAESDLRDVQVKRGKEIITVAVPKHEIKVLQKVHGEANVRDMGDSTEVRELPDSAEAEYDRLVRTYKGVNTADFVALAFPNGPDDLAKFGFKSGGKVERAAGAQVKNRPAKKTPKKSATK